MGSRSKRRGRQAAPPARRQTAQAGPAPHGGQLVSYSAEYHGPIPPASELEAYRQVDPDAPRIILNNFDDQSRHRREMEQRIVDGVEGRAWRGQIFVASLLATAVVGGLAAIFLGHDTAGATVVGTAIGGGALVYVVGGRPSD